MWFIYWAKVNRIEMRSFGRQSIASVHRPMPQHPCLQVEIGHSVTASSSFRVVKDDDGTRFLAPYDAYAAGNDTADWSHSDSDNRPRYYVLEFMQRVEQSLHCSVRATLTEFDRHARELTSNLQNWIPWNCRLTLAGSTIPSAATC